MANVTELRCVLCGRTYKEEETLYTCPHCGLDGTLDVLYDYDEVKKELTKEGLKNNRNYTQWRYFPILPVNDASHIQPLSVGFTPLYSSNKLAHKYGVKQVYIKDDGRNPTGSLKDRASAVGVAKALDFGRDTIACSSTGNAASSMAGFAAVAGLKSFIFVPEDAPIAKVTQLLIYGAIVMLVKGDYEDAFRLSEEAIEKYGWYNRNCGINPYLLEGKKTCGMEIAEQLEWDVPDKVFIAVGDGCCISSLYKAFYDLKEIGFTDRMPQIIGVQAEGCSPVFDAIKSNKDRVEFIKGSTIADSIDVGAPRNWAKALRAVRESRGDMVAVSDEEILDAMRELARDTGVFGEPAGVTGFAGFKKMALEGRLKEDERVAIVVTGNGLKDIKSAQKAAGQGISVEPDIDDLIKKLSLIGSN
ncbi:MAG: threonine synthase [Thermoanaerobacteraceae bacterium]|nr:threonine synthase [Thermoanaerobacteraceae bacterium]